MRLHKIKDTWTNYRGLHCVIWFQRYKSTTFYKHMGLKLKRVLFSKCHDTIGSIKDGAFFMTLLKRQLKSWGGKLWPNIS
jgi:hypothetical protein